MLRILAFMLWLASAALAQDKAELLRTFRNAWSGAPLEAAIFDRFVDVQADADWWAYLVANPTRKSAQFVGLGASLATVASNLGWGDAQAVNSAAGGQADAPPLVAMLDSWKGKMAVKLVLPSGLKQEQKDQVLDNIALLNSPMVNSYANLPRGGRFFLNVSCNPKATAVTGKASKDGTTFDFVFPANVYVTSMPIEDVFKQGLK